MPTNPRLLGRRDYTKLGLAVAAGAALATMPGIRPARAASDMDALIAAAKKEGKLNVITLPRDWANYGALMDGFTAKYGIAIDDANPDGSSAQELQAVRSLKGQDRAPDALDIGPSFASIGVKQNLFTPYKVATWATIPDGMKEADGLWVADYFGVVSIATNTTVVKNAPRTWADLKKPEYKGMVALNGSPLGAGAAFAAVFAASLGNGGSYDDIEPGVAYFGELAKVGNMNPAAATGPALLVSGQAPIVINWDYLSLGYRDMAKGKADITVVVPEGSTPYGSFYCQAIPADAAHPNAAKLWQEYLYSDEGQLLFLAGYAHPARYADLASRNLISADLASKLPPAAPYANVKFATQEQVAKAQKSLAELWPKMVKI
ncbi:ABC transporter substrate-binding protein [Acidisoma cladoniae]|jgi:putative spermidine/putrescine transport system substrate-binding protein|uniref:ABC transporter substrate-binding protein n=1 Tax=Acidisoma cladoniae TaxID=3040935 RepID=UPI00254CA9BF|nr:extracellular solute-binding protein [Acidisoma sp. PAMC 29798]